MFRPAQSQSTRASHRPTAKLPAQSQASHPSPKVTGDPRRQSTSDNPPPITISMPKTPRRQKLLIHIRLPPQPCHNPRAVYVGLGGSPRDDPSRTPPSPDPDIDNSGDNKASDSGLDGLNTGGPLSADISYISWVCLDCDMLVSTL
ncbi:hypothetical protein L226DRAFT_567171 [Lentinus tigrinus ALCF2SS1-7]|uniref:Uncharacterized protein n=1 Tax=Lentinus tigrinus ALCF2SS1-6 TaxID=1328759 RepID=A0A5C2SPP5_9APHY|nr:hypothetical protein L227DRAFT_607097 [Lentinus tigrinus ALCF2SS1-6]RPD78974.1 hypothetical protein L226DRAFT_567171 [Lentinus tigrinus ALCF2SS1-7]